MYSSVTAATPILDRIPQIKARQLRQTAMMMVRTIGRGGLDNRKAEPLQPRTLR